MNKKIVSRKKTIISLFLSIILVTGTIALSFSSSLFMTASAQVHPYYGMDNNNYKKSEKDSSGSNISLNKLKCINDNININGVNSGNISIGNKGQVEPSAASSFGYGDERYYYYDRYNNKQDKGFDCVVNNNNKNRQVTSTIPPPTQTPPTPPTENNVYVVWSDYTLNPNDAEILFAVSRDGGQTFSDPENISNNAGDSVDPQITSEGNNVYVVWRDTTLGNAEIFFAASNDNGQTFTTPAKNISDTIRSSSNPQISSEGDNVYVVWVDNTPGNNAGNDEIFFASSTDNGQNFSTPPDNLSNNTGDSLVQQISSEGNNVYVVWQDNTSGNFDIFFAASNDNGQTFTTPAENISNNAGFSFDPQIISEGNNVYVVWRDTTLGNAEIFFASSTDNGQNFSTPPDNLSNNIEASRDPQISSEGNNVYVVWAEGAFPNGEIFFAASNDNGQNFSNPPDNLSNNAGDSSSPRISLEGNNVYVVWVDNTPGNNEIFFASSTDNGQNFSTPPDNLSNNAGDSDSESRPQISTEGNNVYVVWNDNTPGNNEVFFASSTDNGQNFSTPPDNLSNNAGNSFDPQISSSTSQENPNSEIQTTNPQIQMTNPTQKTVSAAAFQQQPGEDTHIIAQGTEEDLSALEKIEKLKKQWLELLP